MASCLRLMGPGTTQASTFSASSGEGLQFHIIHPREVFKTAILANAASVLLAHNHPSGDPTPSTEDLMVTRQLNQAGITIGIEVLDHIVVGDDDRYYSFREAGRMESGSIARGGVA